MKQFKICKIAPKTPGIAGESFWTTKIVAAHRLHAPPLLAACGFMRHRRKLQKPRGSGMSSSPLSFYAGGESHRHLQKPKNTQGSWF